MDTNTNKINNTRRPANNPEAGFKAPANRPAFNNKPRAGGPAKRPSYNRPARPNRKSTAPEFESRLSESETTHIPPLKDGDVRIIHLGGVEEVGRNMSMIEYKDSIVIIDCGVQFTETHTPGIDFILPNTAYLEERKDKIKAMLVTHGHLDHIGAIPYIMPRIGNPTIYSRNFTALMIRKRQEEFPFLDPLKINIVEKGDTITLGDLKVTFFGVTHAIPDSMGIMVETPYGNIVHTGDLRLEHNDNVPTKEEEDRYKVFENTKNLNKLSNLV
jgi:ribonuclease J